MTNQLYIFDLNDHRTMVLDITVNATSLEEARERTRKCLIRWSVPYHGEQWVHLSGTANPTYKLSEAIFKLQTAIPLIRDMDRVEIYSGFEEDPTHTLNSSFHLHRSS